MLNFDPHQDNPVRSVNHQLSRYRRQLILLFAALALTFYGAHWAAKPEHWNWLVNMEKKSQPANQNDNHSSISNSANDKMLELKPGAEANIPRDATVAETIDQNHQYFHDIDDNSTGLLRRELPAYFQMLKNTQDLSAEDWVSENLTIANFTQLIQNPAAFRGLKFKLSGDALMITKIKEPENDSQISETYEIWLRTRDSGNDLVRIRALNLPPGIKEGNQQTHMQVYGLFFKRQGYASVNGNRISPMFLSNKIELPVSSTAPINEFKNQFFYIGTAFLVIVTLLVAWSYLGDRRFEQKVIQKMKDLSPEEKEALQSFSMEPDEKDEPVEITIQK